MRWKIWQGVPVATEDATRQRSLPWRPWRADVTARLTRIEQLLIASKSREEKFMATLDDVQTAVSNEGNVVQSAIVLLQGLKSQLDAAISSGDPAKVQAISDAIGAQTTSLAQAVAANTPASGAVAANIGGTSAPLA